MRLRRDHHRRRAAPASTAPDELADGGPEGRDRRARAGRRRVLLLGLHALEDAAAPRRGARRTPATRPARARRSAASSTSRRRFAWRDFMVSDYDDSGQVAGRGARASTSSAARAASPAPARSRSAATTYTAERHRDRDRLRPGHPADRGPARARGRVDQPRGDGAEGGAAATAGSRRRARSGVEMAQALARMGGSVALVEGADHVLSREPRAARRGARQRRSRPTGSSSASASTPRAVAPRRRRLRARVPRAATTLRGDRLLVATGRRPRVEGIGLENVGIEPGKRGIEVDARMSRRRRRLGDRRRDRHLAADLRRQVPGPGRGGEHPRARDARGELRRRAAGRVHRSAGRRRWARPRAR